MKTRKELENDCRMRMCVCGRSWGWNGKEIETNFHCNNKRCVYWNIITNTNSTPKSELDILYQLVYQKGFCQCKEPKLHEIDGKIVEDYVLCVNHNCFKVLREYEDIVINQSLYPRGLKCQ